ncbi:MAG: hypothetical protein QME66_10785 [Candidatus Eisenbacteria bacterium]|nr:hypothetical protein [Candidatus Eisenbacteria bacterium]
MAKTVSQREHRRRQEEKVRRKDKIKEARARAKPEISFTKKNYLVMGLGILSIVLGYVFLARGSITLAPFLLVLGYVVIIPIGLILK